MDERVLEVLANKIDTKGAEKVMTCHSPFFRGVRSHTLAVVAQRLYYDKAINDVCYLVALLYSQNYSAKDTADFLRTYGVCPGATAGSVKVTRNRLKEAIVGAGIDLMVADMLDL